MHHRGIDIEILSMMMTLMKGALKAHKEEYILNQTPLIMVCHSYKIELKINYEWLNLIRV